MTESEYKLALASKAAGHGKISRRDFVHLAMAAGFTLSASQVMFTKAVRAEPKKGGHFKFGCGHGQTTDSLDPATWSNGFTFHLGRSLTGAPLIQIGPNNEAMPHVAESFEPSDGAKKWVFKLRKGVQYHDGRTVKADDVVAMMNYHTGPDSKSPAKGNFGGNIDTVKADGDDTVIFTLKGGQADFPVLLSDYHMCVYPSKDGKIEWEKGIGAGPYVLKNFEPGVKIEAEINKNYFKTTNFDSVEMLSIVDQAARTNAYLSGEVDYMNRVDLKTVDMVKNAPDTTLYNVSGSAHYSAPMQVDQKPFDKLEVRQALKYAINRQELVDKILYGYGSPGNDVPLSSAIKYAINPEPVYTYDPDKAKSLLKKAGMDGLKVDFSASDAAFSGGVDAALLMADHAKKAGIEINVIREPNDSYWDNVWLKKAWCECYWGTRTSADQFLSISLAADAAWNDTHWKNPRFNELLVQARSELDEKKRAAEYAEALQLVHDDGGQMVLMFNNYVGAINANLGHPDKFNTDLDDDGGYLWERWWKV